MSGGRRRAAAGLALAVLAGLMVQAAPARADDVLILVETVEVDAREPAGATSLTALESGASYVFEASGAYVYNGTQGALNLADPECSRTQSDAEWKVNRFGDSQTPDDPKDDPLDLYVNGQEALWIPVKGTERPAGSGCSSDAHTYQTGFMGAGAPVTFAVYDLGHSDNVGRLTVKIFVVLAEVLVGQATVDSKTGPCRLDLCPQVQAVPGGGPLTFEAGKTYRFEVSGTYSYITDPSNPVPTDFLADAECTRTPQDATWQADRFRVQFFYAPQDDFQDLYVDGKAPSWIPKSGAPGTTCDPESHVYQFLFVPDRNKTVALYVQDTYAIDNIGSLQLSVFLVPTRPEPSPSGPGSLDPRPVAEALARDIGDVAELVLCLAGRCPPIQPPQPPPPLPPLPPISLP